MLSLLALLLAGALANEAYVCAPDAFFDLQHCEACQSHCTCSVKGGCTACVPGYTMYQGTCIQCPQSSGIYGTCSSCCSRTSGTQLSCTDCQTVANSYTFLYSGRCIVSPGCFEIDNNGFCIECFPGFYELDNLCYTCHASCKTCSDSTNCLTCNSGYYWGVINGGLCAACPSGCATCDASSACYSCLSGYYLYQNNCLSCPVYCSACSDGSTCTACSQGILVSNLCVLCTETTYQGSVGCQSCKAVNNFVSCTGCADTYFLDGNGVCQLCSAFITGGLRCTSVSTPTQCQADSDATLSNRYYLVGITCIRNTKNCRKIADIFANCSTCYDGYTLTAGTCTLCPFTGCKPTNTSVVVNVCTCTACLAGYYLSGPSCLACSTANCASCPGNTCATCLSGFYLNGAICSASTATNCLTAATAATCAICNSNYYLGTNNLCYSCQANCLTCTSRFVCSACSVGFFLVGGACVAEPTNCVVVSSSTQKCTLCSYGYYLYEGYCLACKVELGTVSSVSILAEPMPGAVPHRLLHPKPSRGCRSRVHRFCLRSAFADVCAMIFIGGLEQGLVIVWEGYNPL